MLNFKTIKIITAPPLLCMFWVHILFLIALWEIQTGRRLKIPDHCMSIWYANYNCQLDKSTQCRASKVLIDDNCNQGKDDYSDIQESSYFWCATKSCNVMCALGALITKTSCFCLNTVQYIYVVVKINVQRVFYNGRSPKRHVLEKFVRISGVYVHMGIRRSKHRHNCLFWQLSIDCSLITLSRLQITESPHMQNVSIFHLKFGV